MATDSFEEEIERAHEELADEDGNPIDSEEEIEDEVAGTEEPEAEEAEESEETAEDGEEPDEGGESDQPTAENDEELLPPHTWPGEWKEQFNALPAEAKQVMLKMNSDMVKGFSQKMGQLGRQKRELDGLQRSVQPHMERLQRAGETPETVIQKLLSWDAHLKQHGAQGFADMAKAYGFDLAQAQPDQQEYMTPAERTMKQELDQLKAAVQGTQGQFQQSQQAAQMQQRQIAEAQAGRVLADFVNEKDPDGKPSHPYVERVAPVMVGLMQTGQAQDLKSAYDMAVWANPETRTALEKRRQAEAAKANKRKVEKVRKASKAGITSKSSGKGDSAKSFADEVEALYEKKTA